MSNTGPAGIYLIVDFEWPKPFDPAQAKLARRLHDIVQAQSWIKEVVAGSAGIGAGPACIWIWWLENYAALDRLLRDEQAAVGQAYREFFSEMVSVNEKIREEVLFL